MHLLLILGIAVLVFGPKRLPELGKSLGASIRGFKDAMEEHHDDDKDLTKPK
jgi:sec-independent protein translocase protein TatA